MINLVGQKYIREQFERNRSLPLPPSDPRSFLSQNNQANEPRVIQIAVHTVEIELPERVNSRDPELDDSNDNHLEKILPT
ncbi:hypothetical protein RSOLAG1IB_07757 [Rhizoctonia solani AG-1 IB]|uniref:Uncharacterized protein n=1 Tax=Thanatephorus cucumeris (strain AG1-IB / isolate 7/3/14) TaxID=1108050 RepID=A0A0B7FEA3_THACB|nr:hypothetical protein RSOLAG1IB_07757 [Rhizoctonia solani AG-1 IB]